MGEDKEKGEGETEGGQALLRVLKLVPSSFPEQTLSRQEDEFFSGSPAFHSIMTHFPLLCSPLPRLSRPRPPLYLLTRGTHDQDQDQDQDASNGYITMNRW
jgi:hypothetical protein